MNANVANLYRKLRAEQAKQYAGLRITYGGTRFALSTWENAKAEHAFTLLGEDRVRIRCVADDCADIDDLKGDCYDPRVNPDVQASRLAREEKEFEARCERDGVWGLVAEYCDPRTGAWEHADSCWGFVGEDAFASGYAYEAMASAVEKYNEALEASTAFEERDRCILWHGTPILRVSIVEDTTGPRFAIPPHEADAMIRHIVKLLNKHGAA